MFSLQLLSVAATSVLSAPTIRCSRKAMSWCHSSSAQLLQQPVPLDSCSILWDPSHVWFAGRAHYTACCAGREPLTTQTYTKPPWNSSYRFKKIQAFKAVDDLHWHCTVVCVALQMLCCYVSGQSHCCSGPLHPVVAPCLT